MCLQKTITSRQLSFWFDNDFEIASKYHLKIVVLFLKAQILSLQDVVFLGIFFLYYVLIIQLYTERSVSKVASMQGGCQGRFGNPSTIARLLLL